MKRPVWMRILALILAIMFSGCSKAASTDASENADSANVPEAAAEATAEPVTEATAEPVTEATAPPTTETVHEHQYAVESVVAATCASEGYTVYVCACGDTKNDDYTPQAEHTYEQSTIASTTEEEGYTVYICTQCNYAYKDDYTEKLSEDVLNEEQKNSIAMLNYLATLAQQINSSRNSRMFLEEAYASLINNTSPESVNEATEAHLCSLLDTIEQYRFISVKRERLEYVYNQNKAKAIRESLPSADTVVKAISAQDVIRLAASVLYVSIDSVSNYNAYNDEIDQAFLQDGWSLDNEEEAALHENRKSAFLFMIELVREENLPGNLALNESAVENFVTWMNNENAYQRLQFLESEEDTYCAFGNYWLALADCYYELEAYEKCLNAIAKYEECQADIFRKDYYLAQIMPNAIAAAAQIYDTQEYIPYAEKCLDILENNTESHAWALRYFAAQIYLDLYAKTGDMKYLDAAYDLVLNNVNFLVNEQKALSAAYVEEVQEVEIPDDATREEKESMKEYNRALQSNRAMELPAVYEPLLLNCELLFALLEEVDVSQEEREKIEAILGLDGTDVFLTLPLVNRFAPTANNISAQGSFNKTTLSIPVYCVSENSVIRVSVTEAGKTTVYEDWQVKEVFRNGDAFESFSVSYISESISNQKWSADSTVRVEIYDEADSEFDPVVLHFRVSKYVKFFVEFIWFEQTS